MEGIKESTLLQKLAEAKELSAVQPVQSFKIFKKVYRSAKKENMLEIEGLALIGLALACRSMSKFNECICYSFNALRIFESIDNDIGKIKAFNLIGIVYFRFSIYEQALENFEKAVNLLESSNDPFLLTCVINNIGEVYREVEDFPRALDYFYRALEMSQHNNFKKNVAVLNVNIGSIYLAQKKYSKALLYYKKCYNILLDEKEAILLAEVENNIGEVYSIKENFTKASEYYFSALKRLESIDSKYYSIDVLINIGKLEILKNSQDFRYYFEKAINYADEMKAKKKLSKIYKLLAEHYENHNDYELSLKYFKKYHYNEQTIEATTTGQKLEIIKIELKHLKSAKEVEKLSKLNYRLESEIKSQMKKLEEMESTNKALNEKALYDELTGIPNRRHINNFLKNCFAESTNKENPLALFIIDIDNFKQYNDNWGHAKGDECLIKVANCIMDISNSQGDFFGRYGGEEFVYVANLDNINAVECLGNQIKDQVEKIENPSITISIGGVFSSAFNNKSIGELIHLADKELYKAKASGKNNLYFKALCD